MPRVIDFKLKIKYNDLVRIYMGIIINGKYRHFKGNIYEVVCVAKHSETFENMVVYRDDNDKEKVWVRPEKMWLEQVEFNGEKVARFKLIDE